MSVLIHLLMILCGVMMMARARTNTELVLGAFATVIASFMLAAHWTV